MKKGLNEDNVEIEETEKRVTVLNKLRLRMIMETNKNKLQKANLIKEDLKN